MVGHDDALAIRRPALTGSAIAMRILLAADPILPVPPAGYGGIERIVATLIAEFRDRGHTVGLIGKRGSPAPVDAFFPWPGDNVAGRLDTLRNAFALRRATAQFRPDVVHSFARLAYLTAIQRSRRPKIMSYQRHVGPSTVRWAVRLARPGTLHFTGCSDFIRALGAQSGGEWTAIPNFVDLRVYTFAPQVAPDAPLVFLSRLDAIKGPHLAIAVARASGRKLILAGNRPVGGTDAAYFDREVAPHLGRPGIEWIGEVDDAQKNALLGQAAALLLPIQWDEPFGIVFAEALACGTPILTCARGAAPEIVEPGKTGLFFATVAEGAAAVAGLGNLDRTACRRRAESHYGARGCAEQYLSLYRSRIGAAAGA